MPSVMQFYPNSIFPAGWALIKYAVLNENTAPPPKIRQLIGLAAAAQIP